MLERSIAAESSFADAAAQYLRLRSVAAMPGAISARYIRENTEKDYVQKLRSLGLFFAEQKLVDIRWFHMRSYQRARLAGDMPFVRRRRPHEDPQPCPAKPKQVNQELSLLKQIKIKARCWSDEDNEYFEYLQEDESDEQRALDPQEQKLWLDASSSDRRWEITWWWSVISFDTLMSTNELRGLRIGDINLRHQLIRVPWASSKNRFRHREIALENPEVLWSLDRLIARAHDMGSRDPQHYLFPFKVTRSKQAFPDRPMTSSGLKKPWQEIREATGLSWFRMYDTRHTGATRLAEAGVPTEIIVARMGHCSDKMRRHYTHISGQAQRTWLKAFQRKDVMSVVYEPLRKLG